MNKDTKIIVGVILLVAILLAAIGYAAITNINLQISGNATATPSQANFTVAFTGTPTTSGENVKATISEQNPLNATMNVTGLTAKGDKATATYTISNTSADLSAKLTATPSNSNTEYFDVTYNFVSPTIAKGETTTITVTVELIKTPVDANQTSTIDVALEAAPIQPAV